MAYFISVNIFKTKTKNVMAPVCGEKFHRVTLFNDDADKVWKSKKSLTHTLIHTHTIKQEENSEAHFVPFFVC